MILLSEKESHNCIKTLKEQVDELTINLKEKSVRMSEMEDKISELITEVKLSKYVHNI